MVLPLPEDSEVEGLFEAPPQNREVKPELGFGRNVKLVDKVRGFKSNNLSLKELEEEEEGGGGEQEFAPPLLPPPWEVDEERNGNPSVILQVEEEEGGILLLLEEEEGDDIDDEDISPTLPPTSFKLIEVGLPLLLLVVLVVLGVDMIYSGT